MFLIQTVDDIIEEDFALTIYLYCKYSNTDIEFDLIDLELLRASGISSYRENNAVPIGTIEFVHAYMEMCDFQIPKPLNIPSQLHTPEFLSRNVKYCLKTEIDVNKPQFIKQADIVKGYTDELPVLTVKSTDDIVGNLFMISDLIDIDAEYRCFVSNRILVDIRKYIGSYDPIKPNMQLIKKMINEYTDSPVAYTLDIGVNKKDTFIIECHNFYSVGLYGCSNIQIPMMFSQWWFSNYYNHKRLTDGVMY